MVDPTRRKLGGGPANPLTAAELSALTFRWYTPADEDAVLDLFLRTFDHEWPVPGFAGDPREYLRWFLEPHETCGGRIALAELDGRLVSVRSWVARDVKTGSELRKGGGGRAGMAVEEEWRGRGVSSAFSRVFGPQQGIDLTVKFTTRFTPVDAERGVAIARGLSVYLHVSRPFAAAPRSGGGWRPRWLGYVGIRLLGAFRTRRSPGVSGFEVRSVPRVDERFDVFWAAASKQWDFVQVSSAEYVNWRFCDPRAGNYEVLLAEAPDEVLGYAVLRAVDRRGHLLEVLALPGRLDVVRALVDRAVDRLDDLGVGSTECWFPDGHPYGDSLGRAGFVRIGSRSREVTEMLKITHDDMPRGELALLADPATAIHIVEADYDAI